MKVIKKKTQKTTTEKSYNGEKESLSNKISISVPFYLSLYVSRPMFVHFMPNSLVNHFFFFSNSRSCLHNVRMYFLPNMFFRIRYSALSTTSMKHHWTTIRDWRRHTISAFDKQHSRKIQTPNKNKQTFSGQQKPTHRNNASFNNLYHLAFQACSLSPPGDRRVWCSSLRAHS